MAAICRHSGSRARSRFQRSTSTFHEGATNRERHYILGMLLRGASLAIPLSRGVPGPQLRQPCALPRSPAPAAARLRSGRLTCTPRRTTSGRGALRVSAVAVGPQANRDSELKVEVDTASDEKYTVINIRATNRPGVLSAITATLKDLALNVSKAVVDVDGNCILDTFYVQDFNGAKPTNPDDIENIRLCLRTMLEAQFAALGDHALEGVRPGGHTPGESLGERRKSDLLYSLMDSYLKSDVLTIQTSIVNHVEYTIGRTRYRFDDFEAYQAASHSVHDRLIESWNDTNQWYREADPKRVYYLSMEFLMGRSLLNSLYNLNLKDNYNAALQQLGYNLEVLVEKERDAALGNGGLGRLAACFLDSMATLELPAWGYGIRYQYGMFRQALSDGFQREQPDYWLNFGNPWEIERPNVYYPIKYYGHVSVTDKDARQAFRWNAGEEIIAVAYDTPVPGWKSTNCNNLRLWSAKPAREFDLESFNTGDYVSAILSKQRAETISSVLYPDDRTYQGKELRLKQQYFMVSATLQDILRRFKELRHIKDGAEEPIDWSKFPDKVALQLNDTHPTIGVAELMRLFMDENGLGWTQAWDITTKVFSFTNHTVLPEALERWPVELMETLLPRHMQIIYDINWRFIQELRQRYPSDFARMGRMSIIEEGEPKSVRMAHLAIVASHTVNGVAAIHSELIKETIFKDFYDLWPHKFQNKTNGVTQRRWLAFCNPGLRELITRALGTDAWIKELDLLSGLRAHADDAAFRKEWVAVKRACKERLAAKILELTGVAVSVDALFDVQVKRIHEYKRQLMNVMSIIDRYDAIKRMTPEQRTKCVPRVCIIGGKAAPGYEQAKRIIKLISAVGDKINNDPDVGDLLKLVFLPDYNVSLAEVIIPGSEVSQHISTAGTEASGTSNMKFAMNGCLIVGTMDGANVEIAEEIHPENMFIFGASADAVPGLRTSRGSFQPERRFLHVLDLIRNGTFGWADFFAPLCASVTGAGDFDLLANDFPSYLEAQERIDAAYRDQDKWTRMSILSTAGTGKFSSDRTIREYASEIWNVQPQPRPKP